MEGIPAVILGIAVFLYLPDRPLTARWLTGEERRCLQDVVDREDDHNSHLAGLREALRSRRVWLLGSVYFGIVLGIYGLAFWAPQIIGSATDLSRRQIGAVTVVPSLCASAAMFVWGRHSDVTGERVWHVCVPAVVSAVAFAAGAATGNAGVTFIALTLGAMGVYASLPPFWALCTTALSGTAAAGGIALINSIGNASGYVAPFGIGLVLQRTGHYGAGLLFLACGVFMAGLLALLAPREQSRPTVIGR